MNLPKVSVIIPVFNRVSVLKEAIDSVLTQSFLDYELIVINDGSTDKNVDSLICTYKDRIRSFKKQNEGVSAARNFGIKRAQGEYIAFLDSDDVWLKDKLKYQIEFFEQNKEALVVQTEEIWMRNGKRINPKKYHKKQSGFFFEVALNLCLVSPSAVMIKKELFETVGYFDETLKACEDYDLWLRILAKNPIYLIDTPLIIKRGGHDDQLSKIGSLDKYRIKSLKKIIQSNILDALQKDKALKVLKNKCKIYSNGCKKRGREVDTEYQF